MSMKFPGQVVKFVGLLISLILLSNLLGLNNLQMFSLLVLGSMVGATLMFWRYRVLFAFIALSFMLGVNLIDVRSIKDFAQLDTILFLASMMVIVGYLEEKRFFEVLIDRVVRFTGDRPNIVMIFFLVMSALLAALVDEVTSILIMVAVILDYTSRYKINPVPFIVMSIFATNIGSSATVVGNPVGVMIAFNAKLSFTEFLRWATPTAIISLFLVLVICRIVFKKEITELEKAVRNERAKIEEMEEVVKEAPDIRIPALIFLATILGLVFHTPLEELLGLTKNSMLLGIPFFFAGIVLFLEKEHAREIVERRIDWWTLIFFLIFFASVGTLKHVGTVKVLAEIIYNSTNGVLENIILSVFLAGGIMTAFMDNVLAVATWIPIIQTIGELGVNNYPLWWSLLFTGTFWGNLTLIGSTANIVAIGTLEKRIGVHLTLRYWIPYGVAVTIPTVLLAMLIVLIQLPLMSA
ncbi:MAG: SLC13 family permease [Nitrososphaerota archaeon]